MPDTSSAQQDFDYVKKAHKALKRYNTRHQIYSRDGMSMPDSKARRDVRPSWIYDPNPPIAAPLHPVVLSVLRPRLGGVVAKAFPVNTDFESRAAMNIVAMHTELQNRVGSFEGVATCIVSSDNEVHSNKDIGGIAEQYMGLDQAVLPAREKGVQTWDMEECKNLVAAHEKGSLLRLFRQHRGGYRYCGLYRVVDKWRTRVQYHDPCNDVLGPMTCFVKLERAAGQPPVEQVSLSKVKNPKNRNDVRCNQLHNSIVTLQGKGIPEFCANCLIDGNGRNDIYECDGCASRLATNPELPPACVSNGCSNRSRQCIHTVPANICPECVDEKDEEMAKKADSSWCCADCADFYKLWNGRPRLTRGLFMPESELCKATKQPAPAAARAAPQSVVPLRKTPEQQAPVQIPRTRMTAEMRREMAMQRDFELALLSAGEGEGVGDGATEGGGAGPSTKRKMASLDEAGPSNGVYGAAGPSRPQGYRGEAGPSSKVAKRAAGSEPHWHCEDQLPQERRANLEIAPAPGPVFGPELAPEREVSESIAPTEVQDLVNTEELEEDAAGGEEVQQPQAQPQLPVMIKQEEGGSGATSVAPIVAALRECTAIGLDKQTLGRYLNYISRLSAEEREIVYALAKAKDVEMLQAMIDEKLSELAS